MTTQALPSGFADTSDDRDNFKIEIVDASVGGNTIPASQVEIEMLKPGSPPTSFSPRRTSRVELQRVGTTGNLFRSRYLRLVVDDVDQAANPGQTILVDWDSTAPDVEILGQVMRVTYTASSCTVTAEATVGGPNRSAIRVAVHVLRTSPGGAGVVTVDQARTRVQKWFRRVYAQISMTPRLMTVQEIDPLENLVSLSNDTGANATGGNSSQIGFRIRAKRAGHPDVTLQVGPINLHAGATPMATAGRLAALIRPPFTVLTVQNPPTLESSVARGSADLIISDTNGGRVVIENLVSTDASQPAAVGRVNPATLGSWAQGNRQNWIVGSIEQRTVLQGCDTGSDRFDLVVAATLSSGNRGEAMMPGTIYASGRQALPAITMSAFVVAASMDSTDTSPFSAPHELGHDLMDVIHVTGDSTQLMRGGTSVTNAVDASKRFSESGVTFDNPPQSIVQETRIRSMGSSVLEPL